MLKNDALDIYKYAVKSANPYKNTKKSLEGRSFPGRVFVFAIGKAGSPMAQAAADSLGAALTAGLLVTKYGHTGEFRSDKFRIIEASHPVSDENSVLAAQTALQMTEGMNEADTCIVLLSGGGSALFEKPLVSAEKQREISDYLMKHGADIFELNAVRKRLSAVKGGAFAAHCAPARVITLALSDVAGSKRDVIASGITVNDTVTDSEFNNILVKYSLEGDSQLLQAAEMRKALPKTEDGEYIIIGDSEMLCLAACERARQLGYMPVFSGMLEGDAEKAAENIVCRATEISRHCTEKTALIYGGETTVNVRGGGRGGRSQQLALAAAIALEGKADIVLLSAGSDGTDGPTDAAGGTADGESVARMREKGVNARRELLDNNAYYALQSAGDLIVTGATGTNVNDLVCALVN